MSIVRSIQWLLGRESNQFKIAGILVCVVGVCFYNIGWYQGTFQAEQTSRNRATRAVESGIERYSEILTHQMEKIRNERATNSDDDQGGGSQAGR